jgi:hypothetical protein
MTPTVRRHWHLQRWRKGVWATVRVGVADAVDRGSDDPRAPAIEDEAAKLRADGETVRILVRTITDEEITFS